MVKVLFVDDDELIIKMTPLVFKKFKYNAFFSTDSSEALKIFKSDPDSFDIVITDFNMPDITGLTLASEIKSIRPDIPIILCTGFIDEIAPEKINSIGFDKIIYKPYGIMELIKDINVILDCKRESVI